MGADLQEDGGALTRFGCLGQDADIAVGLETVDDPRARAHPDAQSFRADRHTTVGADLEERAHTPDVGPPATARHGAQDAALFAAGALGGGVGVRPSSRWISWALRWRRKSGRRTLAAAGVVMVSAAKSAGSRPCQY